MDEDEVAWRLLEWLLQNLTPETIVGIVLAVLVVGAIGVAGAGLLFVLFRRHPRMRRTLMRLRAERATSGAEAEIIDLRLDLHAALESARRAVASVDEAGALAGDLPSLLQRLEQAADRLDRQLGALEQSVDEFTTPRAVAPARRRVGEVIGVARDVRRAAFAALDVTSAGEIQALTRDVEREVVWVQAGVEAMSDLLEPDRGPDRTERRRLAGAGRPPHQGERRRRD